MLFRTLRVGRDADPLGRCMRRARKEGALCGRREAKLFRLAVRRAADRAKAIDWLNTAVSEGRAELEAQRALERAVEAWDMACRVAFMLEIV
jgi:hypothetical protein